MEEWAAEKQQETLLIMHMREARNYHNSQPSMEGFFLASHRTLFSTNTQQKANLDANLCQPMQQKKCIQISGLYHYANLPEKKTTKKKNGPPKVYIQNLVAGWHLRYTRSHSVQFQP